MTACIKEQNAYKMQYTYEVYTKEQQDFCKQLYKLSIENRDIAYKTPLQEYEAVTVLTDFMLYNPYSYWLTSEYTLYCTDDNMLYLNCSTDITEEERTKLDNQLNTEITNCLEYVTAIAENPKEQPKDAYNALFCYLYNHADVLDGTYRAPIKCCLVDKACNCQGYTYTFMYICSLLGLPAGAQYGNAYCADSVAWTVDYDKFQNNELSINRTNAGHVWIVVPIDGVLYYLDIYAQKLDEYPEPHFLTADELVERCYLWN